MELEVTEVFEWNWQAIHEPCPEHCEGNSKCSWCLGSNRKYKYIINRGSSRSSKTYSLIDVYDLYARANENKRLTVWRDTKTDCKKTVLNDTKKRFRSTERWLNEFRFNSTESILFYNSGSTFEIHGTDDEETVHGLTQDAAWLNEPYKISRDTFDQIDQRTSDFIVVDLNPKKSHWSDDLEKDKRAIVIKSTFKNNPFCPPEQKAKILSYQPVSMCEAVLQGLKTAEEVFAGEISDLSEEMIEECVRCIENHEKNSASAYKWSVYGLGEKSERPNRIFSWQRIPDHEYNNIDATVKLYANDWGKVDPWAVMEVKYYDGALYLHERNYLSENQLRGKMSTSELMSIQQDEEGLVKKHFVTLGIDEDKVIVCDNNRPNKIRALRALGYEYAVAAVKGPITDGIDLLLNLKVYYTTSSTNIEYEQENYSYKVDRYGVVLEDAEDLDNHLMDCARYAAEYLRKEGYINKV